MTDHATPLLRDALARALEAALLSPLDDPPVPTVDRVLRALANDPEVVECVRGLLDRRLTDFGGFAGDNYLDVAATDDAAALFGEPDD